MLKAPSLPTHWGRSAGRDAVGFGDGEDIVAVEDLPAEFVEKVEDARRISDHLVDGRQAIGSVDGAVCIKTAGFLM